MNKLVYAEPDNQAAKDLLADVYEQIGYQKESPSVRNSFLAGAYELRNGNPKGASPKGTGPDMIRAMTTGLWLDFLGIRLDSKKAVITSYSIHYTKLYEDQAVRFSRRISLCRACFKNCGAHHPHRFEPRRLS